MMQLDRSEHELGYDRFTSLDKDWGADDDFLFSFAAVAGASVLQLACGTGKLALALSSQGIDTVGVDRNTLKIAQAHKRTERVQWIKGDARNVRIGRRFDRVMLTGNAFESFATNTDQILLLQTIAAHLAPEGKFAFGIQNPVARPWERWGHEESPSIVKSVDGKPVSMWQETSGPDKTGLIRMQTHYNSGGKHCAVSRFRRFVPRDHVCALLEAVGLEATATYGDWVKNTNKESAPYIIVVGGLKN